MKTIKHRHLNQFDRDRIEALLSSGHKQKEIAKILKVHKSTISREVKLNSRKRKKRKIIPGKYEANLAQHKAYLRRKYARYQGKIVEDNSELRKYVIQGLENQLNPDEISGRMRLEKQPFYASKNSIYRWLYSPYGRRYCCFLSSHRIRRKKRKPKTQRTIIPNRIGIEHRSKDIDREYSHYEGDTIVSKQSKYSLVVLYERKSKYVDIKKIQNLKPNSFNKGLMNMKKSIQKIKSLTLDNGIENRYWQKLGINQVYFCDPYSSWQKGGIENMNKLIRKYIPKGTDIRQYPNRYIKMIVEVLNSKPRKSLGYKTPYEVMIENNLLTKEKIQELKNPREKSCISGVN